jgi:heavy metal sensor kinase
MPTITTRLTYWYMAVFSAIIIIVAVTMYTTYERERREAIDSDLKGYADLLISGSGGESVEISDLFEDMLATNNKTKLKFRAHRFVLTTKDSIVFETNILTSPDSLLRALNEEEDASKGSAFHTVTLNNLEYRTYTKDIPRRRGQGFHLIVITSLERLYESLSELRQLLFLIIPLSIFAAGAGGWFLAKRALRPVRDLTMIASAISSTNLDKRVPIGKSHDELSELATTFNAMISRLDLTFKSQQQFIADASHDLRTPLTVIQMELELLMLGNRTEQETHAALQRSLIELDRLNRLATDLLFLARADAHQLSLNKQPFRLDELLLECASQMNGLAEQKGIVFQINIDSPVEITADESLLRRAIVNIIDNALKFSPEQKKIFIHTGVLDLKAHIEVRDQGPGIPKDELPKIFQRFHRADNARTTKGSGLGLAITSAVILAHGGGIEAESAPGEGTLVKLFLPL